MKFALNLVFAASLLSNSLQAEDAKFQPEPICGFTGGPHAYTEAPQVQQGLCVELFVGEAQINQPVNLRFFVNLKPQSSPLDNLQIEHEKLIHVIGVRNDLSHFFHVHPTKVSPGMWEVPYTFTAGGSYKIWTDVKYRGVSYSFGQAELQIPGNPGLPNVTRPNDSATVSGYTIRFEHAQQLSATETNAFQFSVRDRSGQAVLMENYLGSVMHLVLVREDLRVYLHAHPENHTLIEPAIRFRQTFPKAGRYRLFAQFRPQNSKLPADEALVAEFCTDVLGAKESPAASQASGLK